MGVFVGMLPMKHSFQSFNLILGITNRWCDIIIGLCVLPEFVWLPRRRVLGGGEKIFHLKDLFFLKELHGASFGVFGLWREQEGHASVKCYPISKSLLQYQEPV